jgi:hypothetical protein
MLWWWLITYGKCNLQKFGSNVHLVMCHITNGLEKSNLVATLNPTWAHFVMHSQKVNTYCCKNIHPQVHLVIQYVYTMLLYRNYLDSLSKCIYRHTQVSWFRRKTLDSVLEESYMFLKPYSLVSIDPSLTRIKSHHFIFHTHTHTLTLSHTRTLALSHSRTLANSQTRTLAHSHTPHTPHTPAHTAHTAHPHTRTPAHPHTRNPRSRALALSLSHARTLALSHSHSHSLTHTFKILFEAQHWWERLYICIYITVFVYKSSFHDRKITYLCLRRLLFRRWIFRPGQPTP